MFSLYNAVTEGLKKGSVQNKFKDQIAAHKWFRDFIEDQCGNKNKVHAVPVLEGEVV
jgi:carboxylesterase type B